MPKPKIALFANHGSEQLDTLRAILIEQAADPLGFDIQLAGSSQSRITIASEGARWNDVSFDDIEAVHIRCTAPNTYPHVPPVLNAASYNELRSQYLREQECSAATYAFFEQLTAAGKLVINPLTSAYLDHNAKSQLYTKLRANRLPAPRTIMTNDPDRAAAFLAEVGEAVVKPAIGVGSTRLVTERDIARLDEIARCPVLLQQRMHGETVRVHVVGGTVVLALSILTDGGLDSRTATRGFRYLRLPDHVEASIVRANRLLGLHFSAWDIIGRGEEYCFLDCNPGPFILWIGPEFVRAVLCELARYMIVFARTRSLPEAAAQVRQREPGGHAPG